MLRLVAIASLLCGCRISLEDTAGGACTVDMMSQSCKDADEMMHSDLAFIEQEIFARHCNFSGCHGSVSPAGGLDLGSGVSHGHLVDVSSQIDTTRKLVVRNNVAASYLMLMLRDVEPAMASPPADPPPASIGFMPQGSPTTLCCQKLDAIERWINAGAPNN